MNPAIRRLIVMAVVVEVAVCGWLLAGRMLRPRAVIPASFPDDPLLAGEFAAVAKRAEDGGADDWLYLGQSLLGQGCYGHAERAFERALALDPRNIEAAYGLGYAVERTGRVAEGNSHYQRCLDMPDDPRSERSKKPLALYAIGRNHLRLGDVAAAEAAFRRNEGFPPAMYQLARILYHSDRPKEAAELLARLLDLAPLSLEVHHLRARVMEKLGDPAGQFAAAAMEERSAPLIAASFHTEYVQPFIGRHGLNRVVDASIARKASVSPAVMEAELSALEDLVRGRLIPTRFIPLFIRGQLALEEGRPAAALEAVRQIAAAGDGGANRLLLEADGRQLQGDVDGARELRERAARIEPSARVEQSLAEDADRRGDAAGRDRHRGRQHFLEAMEAYRMNRLESAVELLRKSAAVAPDDATTWFHVGEMEYLLGRRDQADDAFRRALELRPGYGRARDYLERRAP